MRQVPDTCRATGARVDEPLPSAGESSEEGTCRSRSLSFRLGHRFLSPEDLPEAVRARSLYTFGGHDTVLWNAGSIADYVSDSTKVLSLKLLDGACSLVVQRRTYFLTPECV